MPCLPNLGGQTGLNLCRGTGQELACSNNTAWSSSACDVDAIERGEDRIDFQ